MAIFQDSEGVYISMENYIKTMLVKLGMESAVGLNVRTPIHKPIEDMREISKAQVSFFMSACGMLGWLASTGMPDVKSTPIVGFRNICRRRSEVHWLPSSMQ